MTALRKYDRLEASGLWREAPEARMREVVVSLRDTTLLLSDPRTEAPLAQWSLPAVRRLRDPGEVAVFTPSRDAEELLELTDRDMIAALEQLRRSFDRQASKPGRLRAGLIWGGALVLVAGLVLWLPDRMTRHTASALPQTLVRKLGDMGLAEVTRLTGPPCHAQGGPEAAERLAERLFPQSGARVAVVPGGIDRVLALPGGLYVLPYGALETAIGPDPAAGALLVAAHEAAAADPLIALLDHAGLFAVLQVLATGELSPASLEGYGNSLVDAPAPPAVAEALIPVFSAHRLSAIPYAESLQARAPALAEALMAQDPFPTGTPERVLTDEDWLRLQAICG